MLHHLNEGEDTATLDLFSTVALLFLVLLAVVIHSLRPDNTSKANIKSSAEFVITSEWSPDDISDVDLYVKDPLGNICFFRKRDMPLMNLDRDDVGHMSDIIVLPGGQVIAVKENKEIISIRNFIPGEYIVNVHQWADRNMAEPTKVKVQVQKVNPVVTTVYQSEVVLATQGQEATVCRFTIDDKGKVTEVITDMPVEFVKGGQPQ